MTVAQSGLGDGLQKAFELTWEAPDSCPDEQDIRRQVDRLVGAGGQPQHRLVVHGRVTQQEDGQWVLRLQTELDGVHGERAIPGKSCQAVADAGALMLALALNPDMEIGGAEEQRDASPSSRSPATAAEKTPPVRPPAAPVRSQSEDVQAGSDGPRRQPGGFVRALGGLRGGSLPRLGPEFGAAAGLRLAPVTIELGASYSPPQESTERADEGPLAEFDLWTLSSSLAYWFRDSSRLDGVPRRLQFAPALGLEFSWARGQGREVVAPESDTMIWTSGSLGGAVAVPITKGLWARLDGALVIPLTLPEAQVAGTGSIHQPDTAGFRLALGLEQRFRFRRLR